MKFVPTHTSLPAYQLHPSCPGISRMWTTAWCSVVQWPNEVKSCWISWSQRKWCWGIVPTTQGVANQSLAELAGYELERHPQAGGMMGISIRRPFEEQSIRRYSQYNWWRPWSIFAKMTIFMLVCESQGWLRGPCATRCFAGGGERKALNS